MPLIFKSNIYFFIIITIRFNFTDNDDGHVIIPYVHTYV